MTGNERGQSVQRRQTAVVCATYVQFRGWCLDNGYDPSDPELCLVLEEHHARGREFRAAVKVDQREPGLFSMVLSRVRGEEQ